MFVFWTIPHINICCLLNYSSYHHVVFWTIPHITMMSFEHSSSGVAAVDFLSIDQYTHAVQWAERIKARPAVARGLQVLSFDLFLILQCCLLNYSSYNYVVFWTVPHITVLSFELFLILQCCLLNYSSYNNVVFWTIPFITMLSFELFLILQCCLLNCSSYYNVVF